MRMVTCGMVTRVRVVSVEKQKGFRLNCGGGGGGSRSSKMFPPLASTRRFQRSSRVRKLGRKKDEGRSAGNVWWHRGAINRLRSSLCRRASAGNLHRPVREKRGHASKGSQLGPDASDMHQPKLCLSRANSRTQGRPSVPSPTWRHTHRGRINVPG